MTFITHGRILGGTVATPDLDGSLADYCDTLGLHLVERGVLGDLAAAWGAPALADARMAVLMPASGAPAHLRLVEQSLPAGFRPTTTYGWNAFEITVQDVHGWPARLADSGFEIVGPPKAIPGLPSFTAMQMLGRGREMIYLNEVHGDTPTADLPRARSPVDHVFILILGVPDLALALDWYRERLGLEEGGRYTINYTMINRAFGRPDGTPTTLAMAQKGRMPIVEIDGYPAEARPRDVPAGGLPPGNALVTLAVDRLPELAWITPPVRRNGPVHGGRLAATTRGPAGELLELVETG